MDVFIEQGERNLYLHSAFAYKSILEGRTNYNEVRLCLQDNPGGKGYFFLLGDSGFYKDWENFVNYIDRNNVGRNNFGFSIIPYKSLENTSGDAVDLNYKMEYDLKLFDSYDGNPIKVYSNKMREGCDIFTGEFFMSR